MFLTVLTLAIPIIGALDNQLENLLEKEQAMGIEEKAEISSEDILDEKITSFQKNQLLWAIYNSLIECPTKCNGKFMFEEDSHRPPMYNYLGVKWKIELEPITKETDE